MPENVILELVAPLDADGDVIMQEASEELSLMDIDTEFDPVPMEWDSPTTATVDVGDRSLHLVRGVVEDQAALDALRALDRVHTAWIDTPVEPFIDCDPNTAKGTLADVRAALGVDQLWGRGLRGEGIVVGVVDGGINGVGRPPAPGQVAHIPSVTGGFPLNDWGTTSYWGGHGNMCATAVLGMAPNASLYDLRISRGVISDAIQAYSLAIAWFRETGFPQILTNSWGNYQAQWDPFYATNSQHPFTKKVVEALDAGIIVLFSAGNCGGSCPDPRCAHDVGPGRSIWGANGHPRVMTVGAANLKWELIGYSSQGPAALDRHKPDFCGISHYNGYNAVDTGTSAACPIAAGVVALLKQADPHLTQDRAKRAIARTAMDIQAPGWDTDSGWGVIRARPAFDYLPHTGPVPRPRAIWAGEWEPGWTSFMPFTLEGRPHHLKYNAASGATAIDEYGNNGEVVNRANYVWGNGFTHFTPLGDGTRFLLFHGGSGELSMGAIDRNGVTQVWQLNAGRGWSTFMPFEMNGPHVIAYNRTSGDAIIERVGPAGTQNVWRDKWEPDWTHLMPFDLRGETHFLAYKKEQGNVAICKINPGAQGVTRVWADSWTKEWDAFMPVYVNDHPHYLIYKPNDGIASLRRVRDDGVGSEGVWNGNLTGGWSGFVMFAIGGVPHHLIYKSSLGFVRTYRYES